jgi:hypothetical protein
LGWGSTSPTASYTRTRDESRWGRPRSTAPPSPSTCRAASSGTIRTSRRLATVSIQPHRRETSTEAHPPFHTVACACLPAAGAGRSRPRPARAGHEHRLAGARDGAAKIFRSSLPAVVPTLLTRRSHGLVDSLHLHGLHAAAVHREPGECRLKLPEIRGRQLHVERPPGSRSGDRCCGSPGSERSTASASAAMPGPLRRNR